MSSVDCYFPGLDIVLVMQHIIIREKWVKGTQEYSALYFCDFLQIYISKLKVSKKLK